jgi:site-specific recombinase XerD
MGMATLSRHHAGYRIRYRIYYPDGSTIVAYVYRTHRADARELHRLATTLEGVTRQNALTPALAIMYQHHRLLRPADLQQWFPGRDPLAFDAEALMQTYERQCQTQMTSSAAIHRNLLRAGHLLTRLGNLSALDVAGVRRWQALRLQTVSRRTVNIELDVLRQLEDLCVEHGWRTDNPARQLKKLPNQQARLPQALTYAQVGALLQHAQALSKPAAPTSLAGCAFRLVVAGIFFGLRRSELQHLLASDTDGFQVLIRGKRLPNGTTWLPKSRQARVIRYAGIEHPLRLVWPDPGGGYCFSPSPASDVPFHAESLSKFVGERLLRPLGPGCTLHSLRHTFATWRLEMGDSLLQVKGLLGHSNLTTLTIYAHVHPNPMADLLTLLPEYPPPQIPTSGLS